MRRLLRLGCWVLGVGGGLGGPLSARAQPGALYFPPLAGTAWATASPASLGWCQPPLDSLLAFAGRKNTQALLVLHNGRLVVERYYGTYTADSVHYWASAGKSLTAVLVGLAQQDGLLRLGDSTSRYLGRWTSASRPQQSQLTLRHQLTMTTGLDDTPPLPCTNDDSNPGCLRYLDPPATRWAYHTGAYRVLQDVLVQASGAPSFSAYTRLRLGNRIGMAGVWSNYVYYSRARDMARFGLLVLAQGSWAGTPVLADPAYFQAMTTPAQALNPSYGYLWWLNGQSSYQLPGPQQTRFAGPLVPAAPPDLIAALGKNDQKIYVVPSRGLVVVRQGAAAGNAQLAVSSFDNELWARIMDLYCAPTATAADQAAAFAAFPNPAPAVLHLRHPGAAATVRLLDALGREVLRQPAGPAETALTLAALPPGYYLAQWLAADGRVLARRPVLH